MKIELSQLRQRQGLPMEAKIELSKRRIREFYDHFDGEVYVAFSGGKDSTVLLHLVRSVYRDIPAVFANTGVEYPEIVSFVRKTEDVEIIAPKERFASVCKKYGFPCVSKKTAKMLHALQNPGTHNLKTRNLGLTGITSSGRVSRMCKLADKWKFLIEAPFKIHCKCCDVLKKQPFIGYEKRTGRFPFIGVMSCDSLLRETTYLKNGCNAFSAKRPSSTPMAFWIEQDVWDYIHKFNVPYSKIYDMGEKRTGCAFCLFGVHMEKGENRFQRMRRHHPKMLDYALKHLGLRPVLEFMKIPYEPTELF